MLYTNNMKQLTTRLGVNPEKNVERKTYLFKRHEAANLISGISAFALNHNQIIVSLDNISSDDCLNTNFEECGKETRVKGNVVVGGVW